LVVVYFSSKSKHKVCRRGKENNAYVCARYLGGCAPWKPCSRLDGPLFNPRRLSWPSRPQKQKSFICTLSHMTPLPHKTWACFNAWWRCKMTKTSQSMNVHMFQL
jgi:hypothetical protein